MAVRINNPSQIKIESNIAKVQDRLDRAVKAAPRTLLENMRKATFLIKADVATRKLLGQVLNRRTGTLIRSLIPNTPEQAAVQIGNEVRGTVGAQGAIAPYARILEFGGTIPARKILPRKKKALHWASGGRNFFSRGHTLPARLVRGRQYIGGTIRERQGTIAAILRQGLFDIRASD